MRAVVTRLHRWFGLALTLFLIVVAGTGAILPFQADLQRWIAPERSVAAPGPGVRRLDWLRLHDIAEERSGGQADTLVLSLEEGSALQLSVTARPGEKPLGFDEIVLDPYTGGEIARARSGDLCDGRAQILPFLYLLHQNLALGDLGTLLLGAVALTWTIDCFLGFYLTIPAGRVERLRRWGSAWRVRLPVRNRIRLHLDLHRAPGLWLWPLMFVFAWTGVAFNLPGVYAPVMSVLTGYEEFDSWTRPAAEPARNPLDWSAALAAARSAAADVGRERGITVGREREIRRDLARNRFSYAFRSNRDVADEGANTWLHVDATTGAFLAIDLPTGERAGNTISLWLGLIHEAAVFGLPMRILVSASGVVIVLLSVTGVLVWANKRRARARMAARRAH